MAARMNKAAHYQLQDFFEMNDAPAKPDWTDAVGAMLGLFVKSMIAGFAFGCGAVFAAGLFL